MRSSEYQYQNERRTVAVRDHDRRGAAGSATHYIKEISIGSDYEDMLVLTVCIPSYNSHRNNH